MTYSRYFIFFLLGTLFFFSGCRSAELYAQNNPSVSAETDQNEKSLLWEITGSGLTESSFLFGTIHMINSDDYFLPQGTLSAIDAASKVIFEIDMADMNDPLKLMPLMQKAFMKGDTTLRDLVSTEDYALIKAHFDEMGMPIFFLERIKPMFLTVFATGDFDADGLRTGEIKSYEMEFAKIAGDSNKETGGLETVEYQISVFDDIPYSDQANMLVEALKSSNTEDDMFKELVDLYKNQDINGLYEMMKEDESIKEYEDALLNIRNKNWIPLMEKAMSDQRTFFAVGAGHLGGSMGVINLLRKSGYTVKAFKG